MVCASLVGKGLFGMVYANHAGKELLRMVYANHAGKGVFEKFCVSFGRLSARSRIGH